ncbi:hypothetical protein [Tenacibaculum sp. 190524A05c]|uniref:hypothetical protein n=1 Tax=Tenacibaculum platacis TaxID=3137852 RepID=UPI0031FA7403
MNINKLIVVVLLSFSFYNCKVTKGVENPKVKKAINLQKEVIDHPLFKKILLELEQEGAIDWSEGRTSSIQEDLSNYESNTHWLLEQFKKKRGYHKDVVFLWRKFNPFSKTKAATYPCKDSTKLNKWRLKRDKYSILNTLIHERVHSFCHIHPRNKQTKRENLCDAAYIAGDLSEAIISNKMGIKERRMSLPICPALIQKIDDYELVKIIK